ncbi:hypothetical protein [Streptomyces sp. KHY 26]|uniref:hypothetical protein n=1 Tax=Streptomyces sp. KHY 26 TaxID=3097359 RepID=UPI00376EA110
MGHRRRAGGGGDAGGAPEAERATDSALPEVVAVATVAAVEPPWATDAEPGEGDSEKPLLLPPPPPPAYGTQASVRAGLFGLISPHVGRGSALPPHGWSRSTDRKARRPTPFRA